MTKREMYEVIANVFENGVAGIEAEVATEVVAFTEKEIAALDRKNAKAKERAAERRAASDELTEAIFAVLGETPMTVNDILAALDGENLTPAKIVARATKLVKAERVVKVEVKTVDGRKLVGYAVA